MHSSYSKSLSSIHFNDYKFEILSLSDLELEPLLELKIIIPSLESGTEMTKPQNSFIPR